MRQPVFKLGTILSRLLRCGLATLLAGLALGSVSVAQERTMIVLDGSGSMWGQIEGVPKLTIARQTLREVLAGVPASTELGLLAYGHREKGNCGDIELIVPPAMGTASKIADEVDQMSFLGKTPLTDAVRIAAEELRYTEDRATVILITDGIETCGANICELGNVLEAQGVDFTAHVVGFGVSEEEGRQIACLADNTGGQYFAADDAESLVVALNEVVAAPTPETTLQARDQDDNPVNDIALAWEVRDAAGAVVAQTTGTEGISGEFEAGDYTVLVSGEGVSGGMEFSIEEDAGSQTIYVPVERIVLSATLEAPAEVAAGAEFEVIWEGPDDERDYVTIVEVGTKEGGFLNYAYTGQGSPAEITAPDGLGIYELRYVHGPTDKTLAALEITLTEVAATLKAPSEVAAGAEFEVVWSGPSNQGDYITIVEAGAEDRAFEDYAYSKNGSPATITAPDGLGAYEVRYVLGQDRRVLASTPITLTAVSASLKVLNNPVPGGTIIVEWTGPSANRDYITVVEAGAPEREFNDNALTNRGSPAEFKVPRALGAFEVRYVLGQSRRVLASIPITLSPATATLSAPASVAAGGVVEVTWTGPGNRDDFIEIVPAGSEANTRPLGDARVSQGSPLSLFAPGSAGEYEVRYKMRDSGEVLASVALSVQ